MAKLVALIVTTMAGLFLPATSRAGDYEVRSCVGERPGHWGTTPSVGPGPWHWLWVTGSCSQDWAPMQGVEIRGQYDVVTVPYGTHAEWRFDAPPTTRIVGIRGVSENTARHAAPEFATEMWDTATGATLVNVPIGVLFAGGSVQLRVAGC